MRPLRISVGALAVLVAGCGEAAPRTSAPVPATTASPPSSSAPDVNVPAEGDVQADVDLDGTLDAVSVVIDDSRPSLVVRLASGEAAVLPLEPSPAVDAEVRAAARLGDGVGMLVLVDRGASTDLYGMYAWSDGALSPVVLPGGPAAVFAVGASATHASGLACAEDGSSLRVLSAESVDGESFTTTEVVYRLEGSGLVELGRSSGTVVLADPDFAAFAQLDC